MPITVLKASAVETFLARQESLAPTTHNRFLAALRSFTRWLRDQEWGPLRSSKVLIGSRMRNGWLARKKLRSVESMLREREDPRNRALFWLIYDGSLRCQEGLAINIDDISWSDRSILIHGKGDRPREMFFSNTIETLFFVDFSTITTDGISSALAPKRL